MSLNFMKPRYTFKGVSSSPTKYNYGRRHPYFFTRSVIISFADLLCGMNGSTCSVYGTMTSSKYGPSCASISLRTRIPGSR